MSKLDTMSMIGRVYNTNISGECFVVDCKSSTDITVMFYDGYYKKVSKGNLDKGKVKNPFYVGNLTKGVGVFDVEGLVRNNETIKIRTLWNNMIQRCYYDKFQKRQKTYIAVSVSDEWLVYSKFESDILSMLNVDKFLNNDWELDKDLLVVGNRVYSKETCCFIPKSLNSNFSSFSEIFKSEKGVSLLPYGTYRVVLGGSQKNHVGCFKTKEEAVSVYRKKKCERLLSALEGYREYLDDRVFESFFNFIESNGVFLR